MITALVPLRPGAVVFGTLSGTLGMLQGATGIVTGPRWRLSPRRSLTAIGDMARTVRASACLPYVFQAVEIDGYVRTGDLFGVPLLSRRSVQLLVADLDHVRLLRGASGRLVHFPHHHLARYGRFLSRPYVVTVHDLIRFFDLKRLDVLIHRPNRRDRLLLRLDYAGVAGATALIAVSETTKRDVVRHLGVPEERIFVVHEGIDHARFRPVERRLLNERYVLFVGSEQPRKNLAAVLRAFAALKRERRLGADDGREGFRLAARGGGAEARRDGRQRHGPARLGGAQGLPGARRRPDRSWVSAA